MKGGFSHRHGKLQQLWFECLSTEEVIFLKLPATFINQWLQNIVNHFILNGFHSLFWTSVYTQKPTVTKQKVLNSATKIKNSNLSFTLVLKLFAMALQVHPVRVTILEVALDLN